MRTHVSVSTDSKEKLENLKASLGLRSVDAVIQHLCSSPVDVVEDVAVGGDDAGGRDEPARRRRIDVREPLYSLEILAERRGMLEYYTGFDRHTVDLLIRRIGEASLSCDFRRFASKRSRRSGHVLSFDILPPGRAS